MTPADWLTYSLTIALCALITWAVLWGGRRGKR